MKKSLVSISVAEPAEPYFPLVNLGDVEPGTFVQFSQFNNTEDRLTVCEFKSSASVMVSGLVLAKNGNRVTVQRMNVNGRLDKNDRWGDSIAEFDVFEKVVVIFLKKLELEAIPQIIN